jgi:hypothetical protein
MISPEEFERNRAKGSIRIAQPRKPGQFPDLYPEERPPVYNPADFPHEQRMADERAAKEALKSAFVAGAGSAIKDQEEAMAQPHDHMNQQDIEDAAMAAEALRTAVEGPAVVAAKKPMNAFDEAFSDVRMAEEFKDATSGKRSRSPEKIAEAVLNAPHVEKYVTAGVKTVPFMLREAAAVYEERNKLYGDNYKHFGKAMMAIFPNGLTVSTEKEWNKLGVLIQMASKLTRLGQTFPNIHDDSCLDESVYSMMLRELGQEDE